MGQKLNSMGSWKQQLSKYVGGGGKGVAGSKTSVVSTPPYFFSGTALRNILL